MFFLPSEVPCKPQITNSCEESEEFATCASNFPAGSTRQRLVGQRFVDSIRFLCATDASTGEQSCHHPWLPVRRQRRKNPWASSQNARMRASLVVFAMQRQTSQDPSRNSDTSAALGRGWICLLVPHVVETRVDVNRSHASTHAYIVHTHARPRRRRKKSLMRERKREKRFLLSCCCCCNTTI